jgi:hypothetical protein
VLDQALGLLDHHLGDLHVALAGSSKVEEMTSPFTERCMSVTSSGRSSMSSTIRYTSGWFGDGVRDVLQQHRLAGAGGATISARWPLPSGASGP